MCKAHKTLWCVVHVWKVDVCASVSVSLCARAFHGTSEGMICLWEPERMSPVWHLPEMASSLVCLFKAGNSKACLEDRLWVRTVTLLVKQDAGCTFFVITVGFCSFKCVQANQPGFINITTFSGIQWAVRMENKIKGNQLPVCCCCISVGLASVCPCVLWCFSQPYLIWLCFFFSSVACRRGATFSSR